MVEGFNLIVAIHKEFESLSEASKQDPDVQQVHFERLSEVRIDKIDPVFTDLSANVETVKPTPEWESAYLRVFGDNSTDPYLRALSAISNLVAADPAVRKSALTSVEDIIKELNILETTYKTAESAPGSTCEAVPYRVVSARTYASFPVWNSTVSPKLFATIRSLEEYNMAFKGVFLPGIPARPPQSFFDQEQIVAIGIVMQAVAPEKWDDAFTVVGLDVCDGHLKLRYKINPIPSTATHFAKNSLSVAISKMPLERVTFVEDGAEVATLRLSQGQWRHPPAE
jgi:hypothetical protein